MISKVKANKVKGRETLKCQNSNSPPSQYQNVIKLTQFIIIRNGERNLTVHLPSFLN